MLNKLIFTLCFFSALTMLMFCAASCGTTSTKEAPVVVKKAECLVPEATYNVELNLIAKQCEDQRINRYLFTKRIPIGTMTLGGKGLKCGSSTSSVASAVIPGTGCTLKVVIEVNGSSTGVSIGRVYMAVLCEKASCAAQYFAVLTKIPNQGI